MRMGISLLLALPTVVAGQLAPEVIGPVREPGTVFFSTVADLEGNDYVEEEFFLVGTARAYADDGFVGTHPYRTRVVVRRPRTRRGFSGVVVVELLNVTVGYDVDIDWIYAHEHFLRSGYAWVGVTARSTGVHGANGLHAWNDARYGSLDLTADSTQLDDQLSFDVYLQAATAVRRSASLLGPLRPEVLLATGHSASSVRLSTILNDAPEEARVFDGFMLHGGGGPVDGDVDVRVMRINTETDLWRMGQAASRRDDTPFLRTWEIAGASHIDHYYMSHLNALQARDLAATVTLECDRPPLSRVPFRYAFAAAFHHLVRWVRDGSAPPTSPRIELASSGSPVEAARDRRGNARGGIQLPDMAVPVATHSGRNGGGRYCSFAGAYEPFSTEALQELYPTLDSYLSAYTESVLRSVEAGYILEDDAGELIAAARVRRIGSN